MSSGGGGLLGLFLPVLAAIHLVFPAWALRGSEAPSAETGPGSDRPVFERTEIVLGGQKISVEIANTEELRARGLMYRKDLGKNQGMLFIFDSEKLLSFWMKNTYIPLSIGFFDSSKELLNTHDMAPAITGEIRPRTYSSSGPARYALEMNQGWFAKHKIAAGAKFSFLEPGFDPSSGPGSSRK